MKKRVVSAMLWFYAGWTLGALFALVLGLNSILGPIIGAAVSTLLVVDPRHVIWGHREASQA